MGLLDILSNKNSKEEGSSVPKKKVLIVEDNRDIRDIFCEYLKIGGFDAISADNGQSGLEMVQSQNPDIVLLDLVMPIMDGKTMLRKLRDIPEFKKTPVILLTNIGDPDYIKQTQYFNANDLLIKSDVTPAELIKRINLLLPAG